MIVFGLLLGTVGRDFDHRLPAFTSASMNWKTESVSFPSSWGFSGVAEILINWNPPSRRRKRCSSGITGLLPSVKDWAGASGQSFGHRGGLFPGTLPGEEAVLGPCLFKPWKKRCPESSGVRKRGHRRGGPDRRLPTTRLSGAFIPLLTLGFGQCGHGMLVRGFDDHGVQPGPQMIPRARTSSGGDHHDVPGQHPASDSEPSPHPVFGFRSEGPLPGPFPPDPQFCLIGVYSLNNSTFEIYLDGGDSEFWATFSRSSDFEPAPLILAVVLGPMMEDTLEAYVPVSGGGRFSLYPTDFRRIPALVPC